MSVETGRKDTHIRGMKKKRKKKRQTRADGEHKHTNKPEMRGKASPVHVQTTGAICRLVFFFCFCVYPSTSIPSSLPQQGLLSSLSPPPHPSLSPCSLSVCPRPPLPVLVRGSSSSRSSLQYTVPGGDSSKSNCLSISHQYSASRGSCPLKTMKVGLSAGAADGI